MRALSVRQPWAFAIVIGAKTVENRDWASKHLGPLAIHASKTEERDAVDDVLRMIHEQLPPPLDLEGLRHVYEATKRLGCVVGAVDMIGCTNGSDAENWEGALDQWFTGPYGFVLQNARVVRETVPCRGRLGIWRLPSGATIRTTVEGRRFLHESAEVRKSRSKDEGLRRQRRVRGRSEQNPAVACEPSAT